MDGFVLLPHLCLEQPKFLLNLDLEQPHFPYCKRLLGSKSFQATFPFADRGALSATRFELSGISCGFRPQTDYAYRQLYVVAAILMTNARRQLGFVQEERETNLRTGGQINSTGPAFVTQFRIDGVCILPRVRFQ